MQDNFSTAEPLPQPETYKPVDPPTLTKRIGGTTYQVKVHFSKKSKETMDEKIKRMIEQESAQANLIPEIDTEPEAQINKMPKHLTDGKNDQNAENKDNRPV
jgi:hypothetical protein